MKMLSATDLAIAIAMMDGTLAINERESRFGGTYFSVEDDFGLIEVQMTKAELDARLDDIRQRSEAVH